MTLEYLLRFDERTGGEPPALDMAQATCEAMARGGMYDQLGGGFARYSVDATWTVPHFEKMLYDNALLAGVYTHLWRRTGSLLARRVAEETCDFMLRELRTAEGGFAASLDADSDGSEGAFYVWTPEQLREVLGEEDGAFAASAFGVTESGTFEHGASVLQRRAQPQDRERFDRIRGVLLTAREERTRPARDDKVVAAWNGMAIGALAEAGVLFDRPDLLAAATEAAELLFSVHLRQPAKATPLVGTSRLLRTSRDGVAGPSAGLLEDYACVAAGLIRLSGMTGEASWAGVAGLLLDTVLTAFADGNGGFYDTADDGERLIFRPADPTDNATPSGTFAAADALLSYGALTGVERYRVGGHRRARGAAADRGQVPAGRRDGPGGDRGAAVRARRDRHRRPGRRPAHRRPAPRRAARGATRRGLRPRHRLGRVGDPAARRPSAGLRRARGLRVPRVHLPCAGHHAGRAARGAQPGLISPEAGTQWAGGREGGEVQRAGAWRDWTYCRFL